MIVLSNQKITGDIKNKVSEIENPATHEKYQTEKILTALKDFFEKKLEPDDHTTDDLSTEFWKTVTASLNPSSSPGLKKKSLKENEKEKQLKEPKEKVEESKKLLAKAADQYAEILEVVNQATEQVPGSKQLAINQGPE